MTRVLLVCNAFDDKWIGALVRNVKTCDPSIQIDVYNTNSHHTRTVPYASLCRRVFLGLRHFPNILYKIPKVRGLLFNADNYIGFKRFAQAATKEGKTYDVINFSFIFPQYLSFIPFAKKISNKIVLTTWGSDVLRRSEKELEKLRRLVGFSNYVTCPRATIRFFEQVESMLAVPEEKFIDTDFGVEIIDHIAKSKSKDKEISKEHYGLSGKYVIVCGYNASPAQNHIQIIDAIYSQKEKLPKNICLLLPMTYGGSTEYNNLVERKLQDLQIDHLLLKDYLSFDDVAHIRICADMFIHAQTTDANSGSVAEHLLCKSKVVNASWLSYPQWEKYGEPYYVFNSFNKLGETIVAAYQDKRNLIDDRLIEDIKKTGWNTRAQQWCDLFNSCAK